MKVTNFREVILAFLMVLVAYGYFSPDGYFTSLGDWNTNSRLSLVKAVVEEGRFEIDDYRKDLTTGDKAFFDGHYYSDKALGSALLGIEFYAPIYAIANSLGYPLDLVIFKELLSFLAISLLCAFLAPMLYSFAEQ